MATAVSGALRTELLTSSPAGSAGAVTARHHNGSEQRTLDGHMATLLAPFRDGEIIAIDSHPPGEANLFVTNMFVSLTA